MRTTKMSALLFAALFCGGLFAGDYLGVEITSIRQRYPWNGKVDIDFTVASTRPEKPAILTFTAVDNTVSPATNLLAQTFDGSATNVFAVTNGSYRTTWDTDSDLPRQVIDRVSFKIAATTDYPDAENSRYMVVDLRKGPAATAADRYPVHFLPTMPLGMAAGADKTEYLVLRRVPATTSDEWKAISGGKDYFLLGSAADEVNRGGADLPLMKAKITHDFYVGIYEVTQRQYELLTGERPSYFTNEVCWATRPVENLLANTQIGAFNKEGTPLNRLYQRSGHKLRLPTEAEWEHACRAGTETPWNNGGTYTSDGWGDANLEKLGRFRYNGGYVNAEKPPRDADAKNGTRTVGMFQPNAFGLYDMHGNVSEMCRDYWFGGDFSSLEGYDADSDCWIDPGFFTYQNRDYQVRRGGDFTSIAKECAAPRRSYYLGYGDGANAHTGFRLVCTVGE